MSTARMLLATAAPLWHRIATHPFVAATGDGSLDPAAFDRWIVEDYSFVVRFRRFLGALIGLAPDPVAADVLVGGLASLQAELDLFRREASSRGLDLTAEPAPTTLGYTSFLQASLQDGYPVAATVLYGAEKAYYDAWAVARASANRSSPYWPFIDNWSSDAFAGWVAALSRLLDGAAPSGPTPAMCLAFDRVVRFELRFWDAVYAGESWGTE